jgi:hypothetical protein
LEIRSIYDHIHFHFCQHPKTIQEFLEKHLHHVNATGNHLKEIHAGFVCINWRGMEAFENRLMEIVGSGALLQLEKLQFDLAALSR